MLRPKLTGVDDMSSIGSESAVKAEAKRALEWGARLCRTTPDSSITVISVAPALEAAPPIRDAVDPTSDLSLSCFEFGDGAARRRQ